MRPARKRRDWRTLTIGTARAGLVMAAVGWVLYRGAGLVAHAHMLRVDRIVVRGNERLSTGDVLAVLNGLRGESLLWTDLNAWRRRLLASPWVREAALRRSLPSTVEVVVTERQPMGIGRVNGDVYLVDDRGVIIDQYGPHYADLDLPIIDGLATAPSESGLLTDEARADLAARLIGAIHEKAAVSKRLSQVDVSDLHNAAVILNGDPAVIRLGDDQFLSRLQSYLELAPALRERVPDIDYVDMRFENRIYVRPSGKAARVKDVAASPVVPPKAGRHRAVAARDKR